MNNLLEYFLAPRVSEEDLPSLLTDVNVSSRRTFSCQSLVKSQLRYLTQVWSPNQFLLKAKIERVQRRATRWILQTRVDEMFNKERLVTLNLLPLALDRELKDLAFYLSCLFGFTDINILEHTSFTPRGRTRQSNSFNLKTPLFRTSTFKASYFNPRELILSRLNRITKLWNFICSLKSFN